MVNRKELDPTGSPRERFGERLRRLREERGWTQDELGVRMGCTGTHISAVETGRRPPTGRFSASADKAFGTGDSLERQSRALRDTAILEGFPEYAAHETRAAEIRLFELGIVPGLLQTPEYAAAIATGAVRRGAITEQQAEERLTLLAERQTSLERAPRPLVYAVLDESCIRRPVGGPGVMDAQLDKLVAFAELPSTVLQVAPFDLGERRAFDLPVTLLTLLDRSQIAYSESAQQGQLERDMRFVQPMFTAYHQLQAEAASQAVSVAMIEQLRKDTS
ncbi:helix-turn-helix transcriptional regulator [Streptomyces turgidiscabies]|uniref:Toxin-antitoxin system, antitoxin component, Xre family n=1 Tax=Streptomyces turgidiscabies (strain Car8) TaxID=698760 RepID=L7F1G7_STRT8|nr:MULTISPECIES: helix-turn-helix transcriptional regulator [Streptomyces]ELP65112.1 toxin-antitoxin system, antitoxin component, Xre family [Streptomyces turgidiscabies Car8]MDX3497672.1 helix-turn-helix transcriptional regulator [Streptomyces turgidiscabies]